MRVQNSAPVTDNEGLHVVPPEAGGEEGQDALVAGSQLQEVRTAGTFLLVRTEPRTDRQRSRHRHTRPPLSWQPGPAQPDQQRQQRSLMKERRGEGRGRAGQDTAGREVKSA